MYSINAIWQNSKIIPREPNESSSQGKKVKAISNPTRMTVPGRRLEARLGRRVSAKAPYPFHSWIRMCIMEISSATGMSSFTIIESRAAHACHTREY